MGNQIQLADVIFVDNVYSQKHPHMVHRHADVLELLYIAEESGQYIVGNYEYAVTAGDFVICNANIPHGEDPFQKHQIQTYCLVLSGVKLENFPTGHLVTENQRPIISLGKENFVAQLLPKIYQMFHKQKDFYDVCRHFALGIFFLLQRLLNEHDENLTPTQKKRERLMYRITDYLNEHFAEPLTLKKISERKLFFVTASSKTVRRKKNSTIGKNFSLPSSVAKPRTVTTSPTAVMILSI